MQLHIFKSGGCLQDGWWGRRAKGPPTQLVTTDLDSAAVSVSCACACGIMLQNG